MWAIKNAILNRSTPFIQCFFAALYTYTVYEYTVLYKVIHNFDFRRPTLPTSAQNVGAAKLLLWAMWAKNIAHTIAHIAHNCHNYHTNLLGYIKYYLTE